MAKLLILVVIIATLAGGAIYFIFFNNSKNPVQTKLLPPSISSSSSLSDDQQRIRNLEEQMANLKIELGLSVANLTAGESAKPVSTSNPSIEARLKILETSVAELKVQMVQLKASPTATPASTSTSSSQADVYIPIGANGSANNQAWYSLPNFQISLNPSDFPGYQNAQLILTARLVQSVGTANLRLYNATTNTAVSPTVSTTSTQFSLLTSSTFQLTSGANTYYLQVESTQNYTIEVSDAKIKINY